MAAIKLFLKMIYANPNDSNAGVLESDTSVLKKEDPTLLCPASQFILKNNQLIYQLFLILFMWLTKHQILEKLN